MQREKATRAHEHFRCLRGGSCSTVRITSSLLPRENTAEAAILASARSLLRSADSELLASQPPPPLFPVIIGLSFFGRRS